MKRKTQHETQAEMSSFFERNFELLKGRFPRVAEFALLAKGEKLSIMKAVDGGIFYARQEPNGSWTPLSPPDAPIKRASNEVAKMSRRLEGDMGPAMALGLAPGYALDMVFRHFESRAALYEPFRRIYVIADSAERLFCWLAADDRSKIIENPKTEFYLASDVQTLVELCEKDLSRSHLFIPVSELPPPQTARLLQPFADLFRRREAEAAAWFKESCDYYNALSDAELLNAITLKGGRKPRLMMPAHAFSTVVQYSARDACAQFERLGWETRILKTEHDLPPWHLAKAIHEFKPDLFLFINHLRTEDVEGKLYPPGMLFGTWVQDTLPAANSKASGEEWSLKIQGRNRDFLAGYVSHLAAFGYPCERLHETPMLASPEIFHPVELPPERRAELECEVCFASNRGQSSDWFVENRLLPLVSSFGFSLETLRELHAAVWKEYREGGKICSLAALKEFVEKSDTAFKSQGEKLSQEELYAVLQHVFWQLDDPIYRHAVLEWLDAYAQAHSGFRLRLYGQGWDKHPTLSKYAKGVVPHGPALNEAYNAARLCLHLNALEGQHQRLLEILAAGATPLTRGRKPVELKSSICNGDSAEDDELKRLFDSLFKKLSTEPLLDIDGLNEWFKERLALESQQEPIPAKVLRDSLARSLIFDSKAELYDILDRLLSPAPDAKAEAKRAPAFQPPDACGEILDAATKTLGGKPAEKRPPAWEELTAKASLLASRYRYEEAKALVEESYRVNPLQRDAAARVALCVLRPQWLFKEGLEWFDADEKTGRLSEALLPNYAFHLAMNGREKDAENAVEKYCEFRKSAKDGWEAFALALIYDNRISKAFKLLKGESEEGRLSPAGESYFLCAAMLNGDFEKAGELEAAGGCDAKNACLIIHGLWLGGAIAALDLSGLAAYLSARQKESFANERQLLLFDCLLELGDMDAARRDLAECCENKQPQKAAWLKTFFALIALRAGAPSAPEAAEKILCELDPLWAASETEFFTSALLFAAFGRAKETQAMLEKLYKVQPFAFLKPLKRNRYEWTLLHSANARIMGHSELALKCEEWTSRSNPRFSKMILKNARLKTAEPSKKPLEMPPFKMPWELPGE